MSDEGVKATARRIAARKSAATRSRQDWFAERNRLERERHLDAPLSPTVVSPNRNAETT